MKVGQSVDVGGARLRSCEPTRTDNASTWRDARRAATPNDAASRAFRPSSGWAWPQPPGNRSTTEDEDVTGTLASRRASAKASRTFSNAACTVLAPEKQSDAALKTTKTTGGSPPRPGFVSWLDSALFPKKAVAALLPVYSSINA